MTYYNTTNLEGVELQVAKENAQSLEDQVLSYYANQPNAECSASAIYRALGRRGKTYPITSVRRAITNLTAKGFLEKTENKSIGIYGKPEYKWKFNTNTL